MFSVIHSRIFPVSITPLFCYRCFEAAFFLLSSAFSRRYIAYTSSYFRLAIVAFFCLSRFSLAISWSFLEFAFFKVAI